MDTKIITVLHVLFFICVPILVYFSPKLKNEKVIKVLAILGGITYPLYLLHQKIGNSIINFAVAQFEKLQWNYASIGFEILIITIAYFVFIQDKKLRGWLKEKYFK